MSSTNSVATIENYLGQAVIDALIAADLGTGVEEGNPVGQPIIYHGSEPDDCCPPVGSPPRVIVWWTGIGRPPSAAAKGCAEPVTVELGLRFLCCWPAPKDPLKVDARAEFSPTAEYLARVAWVGYNALVEAAGLCGDRPAQSKAVSENLGFKSATVGSSTPRRPMGTCAGVDWKISLIPTGTDVATWTEPLVVDEGP